MNTQEFIEEAKKMHGDRYDYSKVKYVNTRRKVCIICPKHGEFWQMPLHHLKGSGCPNCVGNKRLTTEEFIRRAKDVHGDRYDYSKVEYVNARTKVCIICPEHGEFRQTSSEHLRGQGCPKCAHEKQVSSSTITTEEFIRKAKEVHGDRYDYSKVEYVNTRTKVRIICPEHGEFLQIPNNHLQGQGCPYCAGKIRLTTEEFIRKAKEVHGDRYDYSKVEYMNGPTKVCIICPEHGEFWQISRDHLQGQGCPKCAQEKRTSTTEEFIHRANEVHGNRYDYSKVEYINAMKKVCIICPKHGEFWQIPASHLSGRGCRYCADNIKRSTEEFIRKSKKIHGNKYDYSKVQYINNSTKVCIICPEHGKFWQVPSSHLRGKGCPNCNESQMEKNTANFLEENNIEYIRQARKTDLVWLGRQSLDFYLPKYNIAIECQGIQHFESVAFFGGKREYSDELKRDLSKYNKCLSNNVNLIYYVPESLVEEVINNTKYNNIYNSENVFSDLTEFNEKYLVI